MLIWLPTFLLIITCVLDVQMGHVKPFYTSTFQYFFNDIKNSSNRWVLTFAIALWKFASPFGTPIPTMGVHLGVWGFIPSHSLHSRDHVMWLPASFLACNLANMCLSREAKARVTTMGFFLKTIQIKKLEWNKEKLKFIPLMNWKLFSFLFI